MKKFFERLADSFSKASDLHKKCPQLAFECEVVSEHVLLGRAIKELEIESVIGRLYACCQNDKRFVLVKISNELQGFVSSIDPLEILTLSELRAVPYPSSIGIVLGGKHPRLVESIGLRGDGSSFWLTEPRWSETKQWIADHIN